MQIGLRLFAAIALAASPAAADVYRSTDGGKSWAARGPKDYVVSRLTADPKDPAVAWVVAQPTAAVLPPGVDPRFASPVLLRTADGGQKWEKIASYKGSDPLCVAIDPANSATILVGGWFGSISRSIDAGQTWEKLPVGDFDSSPQSFRENTSCNVGSLAMRGERILAGFERAGSGFIALSEDSGKTWLRIQQDGCFSCVLFEDRILAYTRAWDLVQSSDGGKTWTRLRTAHCYQDSVEGTFALSPDGKEVVFARRDETIACLAGEDWKPWKPPAEDECLKQVLLLGKEALALVRQGATEEHKGHQHFRVGDEVLLKARDASGEWSARTLPEDCVPESLVRAGDGGAVWLLTK